MGTRLDSLAAPTRSSQQPGDPFASIFETCFRVRNKVSAAASRRLKPATRRETGDGIKPKASGLTGFSSSTRILIAARAFLTHRVGHWFVSERFTYRVALFLLAGALMLASWIVATDHAEISTRAQAALSNLDRAFENDIARNVELYDVAIQETARALRIPGISASRRWSLRVRPAEPSRRGGRLPPDADRTSHLG